MSFASRPTFTSTTTSTCCMGMFFFSRNFRILRSAANNLGEIPQNWELQIPFLKEFFWGENTLGLVPSSHPHSLGYACTLYAPTSPRIFKVIFCLAGYRCILNYYPINSKTILWGNSEIAPLEVNCLMIRFFGVIFTPKTLVDPHHVIQNYAA